MIKYNQGGYHNEGTWYRLSFLFNVLFFGPRTIVQRSLLLVVVVVLSNDGRIGLNELLNFFLWAVRVSRVKVRRCRVRVGG